MSLVLSPVEIGLLRKVLSRSLVSKQPDIESSMDVNGNHSDTTQDDEDYPGPMHPARNSTPGIGSSGTAGQTNCGSKSSGRIPNSLHLSMPSPAKTSTPSSVPPATNNNKPPPIFNLAKLEGAHAFKSPDKNFQACSPIEEEGTAIIVTAATPEASTDSETRKPDWFSIKSTPSSSKRKTECLTHSDLDNSFKSPMIRRSDIAFGRFIGKGGFGTVHEGVLAGKSVAIKVVMKRRGSGIHREILQAERLAYKLNLRHKNIVAILGVNLCDELRGDALIVMELVSSRSLQELLDDVTYPLHRRERFRFATEIASALQYLHSNEVAHLDVKPTNVLMTPDNVCKMSDFGSLTRTSPRAAKEEVEFTQLLGTLPYRAPELMQGLFPSTKADLYSFGILLWQMVTREQPHQQANPHSLIYQVVKWNIRPTIPDPGKDEVEILYTDLYTACWDRDVHTRPDAGKIVEILSELQKKILQ